MTDAQTTSEIKAEEQSLPRKEATTAAEEIATKANSRAAETHRFLERQRNELKEKLRRMI